jgi:hypothetical protein
MRRAWAFKAIVAVVAAPAWASALFLGAALYDSLKARALLESHYGRLRFARVGEQYRTASESMIGQAFPARKASGELRVFVLGSSQAMGTPFAHQDFEAVSGRLLGFPNGGGLATWLEQYLASVAPGRRVRVICAAEGGGTLSWALEVLRDTLELGEPDAVVILEGNNERPPRSPSGAQVPKSRLKATLRELGREFDRGLAEIARLAAGGRARVYLLTVPNNLRDWAPVDSGPADDPAGAAFWAAKAKALDAAGRYREARACYQKAKDLDLALLRTRTPWNEAIRRLRGRNLAVIDLERAMFAHARDGIPGSDLFIDYCHMKLGTNRLAGYETAKRLAADLGLAAPVVEAASVEPYTAAQLRRLYRIKAFKWARAGWLARLDAASVLNAHATAEAYAKQAKLIDEQAEWLRNATP